MTDVYNGLQYTLEPTGRGYRGGGKTIVYQFAVGDKVAIVTSGHKRSKVEFGSVTVVLKNKVRVATPANVAGVESGVLERDFSRTGLELWGSGSKSSWSSASVRLVSETKGRELAAEQTKSQSREQDRDALTKMRDDANLYFDAAELPGKLRALADAVEAFQKKWGTAEDEMKKWKGK